MKNKKIYNSYDFTMVVKCKKFIFENNITFLIKHFHSILER